MQEVCQVCCLGPTVQHSTGHGAHVDSPPLHIALARVSEVIAVGSAGATNDHPRKAGQLSCKPLLRVSRAWELKRLGSLDPLAQRAVLLYCYYYFYSY